MRAKGEILSFSSMCLIRGTNPRKQAQYKYIALASMSSSFSIDATLTHLSGVCFFNAMISFAKQVFSTTCFAMLLANLDPANTLDGELGLILSDVITFF